MTKKIPKISFWAIVSITAIIFLILLISEIAFRIFDTALYWRLIDLFLVSILISTILTTGFMALSPSFFAAISTLRRLARFENLSHPLLLRLAYEAPGTYHHAINVSILAQKAAKAIGADPMLIRVAAYYHDIGKLNAPYQYIENQSGEEIPKIESAEYIRNTAKKIISHVKIGVDIANKNFLPSEISNLIAEHHGTTRVLYFYERAKEKGLKIKKTDFRYAGPTPQSKEAAILMLSDSVEAGTRAFTNLTPLKIREIVHNTTLDKINENQFQSAKLSNHDLVQIEDSLVGTLCSIYHQRLIRPNDQA